MVVSDVAHRGGIVDVRAVCADGRDLRSRDRFDDFLMLGIVLNRVVIVGKKGNPCDFRQCGCCELLLWHVGEVDGRIVTAGIECFGGMERSARWGWTFGVISAVGTVRQPSLRQSSGERPSSGDKAGSMHGGDRKSSTLI